MANFYIFVFNNLTRKCCWHSQQPKYELTCLPDKTLSLPLTKYFRGKGTNNFNLRRLCSQIPCNQFPNTANRRMEAIFTDDPLILRSELTVLFYTLLHRNSFSWVPLYPSLLCLWLHFDELK